MLAAAVIGGGLVALISVLLGQSQANKATTLKSYYIADQRLSNHDSAHLYLASSLSLNGLFYHTWLGYQIGIYSLLIQGIWCCGYLILAYYAPKLKELAENETLPGNLRRHYGSAAGVLAAALSIFGLTVLTGWELSIATYLGLAVAGVGAEYAIAFVAMLALVAAFYTIRGGLLGNLRANKFQNVMKTIVFIIIISFSLAYLWQNPSGQTWETVLKPSISVPLAAIGAFALLSNATFSLLWQSSDLTTWQNVSSTAEREASPARGLRLGALRILFAPGLVGTLFGMSLANLPNLTDAAMLPTLAERLHDIHPVLAGALFAGLTAAMLSTVDGLLLGASYAFTRDIAFKDRFRSALNMPDDTGKEAKILAFGYFIVLISAFAGIGIFILIQAEIIGLFEAVYIAVVGQMAIAPAAVSLFARRAGTVAPPRNAVASMLLGLTVGVSSIVLQITGVTLFGYPSPEINGIASAPFFTVIAAWIGLYIPNFGGAEILAGRDDQGGQS